MHEHVRVRACAMARAVACEEFLGPGRRADVAEWGRCEGEGGGREQVRRRVSVHAPLVISASARSRPGEPAHARTHARADRLNLFSVSADDDADGRL